MSRLVVNVDGEGWTRCSVCEEWKPVSEFAKHSKSTIGLQSYCKSCHSIYHLNRRYNITAADFERMKAEQNGVCKWCHLPETRVAPSGKVWELSTHHDHVTGEVVCLLCDTCNRLEGMLRTYPVRALLVYSQLRNESNANRIAA